MKRILCLLFGHNPVKGLYETPELISNKGCKRCGSTLISPGHFYWKGVRSVPPPGSNRSEWDEWCNEKEVLLRKEFKV
jgi:hypothetical protein